MKTNSAQTKPRGKSKEGGRSPLLGRFKGIAKGQGSHANPAKRFVWEKEEQRNGRGLSAASGGRDEGCGVCSDAKPPLPFSFYRQRLFLCHAKKKGLNIAISGKAEKNGPSETHRAFGAFERGAETALTEA